jgi:hypothetical protein
MPPKASLPVTAGETLAPLLRKTKTKAEFQRVQSIWLRAALNLEVNRLPSQYACPATRYAVCIPASGYRARMP